MPATLPAIVLSMPPKCLHPNANRPTRNARGVMMGRSRQRKQYRQQAAEAGVAWIIELFQHRSHAPRYTEATVQLTYALHGKQRQDADNLLAWAKSGIDGLVDAGVFADDDRITWLPVRQEFKSPFPALSVQIVQASAVANDVAATVDPATGDVRQLLLDVRRLLECYGYSPSRFVPPSELESTRLAVLDRIDAELRRDD